MDKVNITLIKTRDIDHLINFNKMIISAIIALIIIAIFGLIWKIIK
jgi:hypothetical protein